MILLKFQDNPGEFNMAARLEKPVFVEVIKKILMQSYQETIAQRYSTLLNNYIYEKMIYPEQGIYCTVNNVFWRYDEKQDICISTEMKETDYVINQSSEIWNCFDNEFKYLKKDSHLIKKAVQEMSEKMFFTEEWTPIISIDLKTYKLYTPSTGCISKPISDFFTGNYADKIVSKVTQCLFKESNTPSPVLVMYNDAIKTGLLNGKTVKINSESIENVREMLSYELEQQDALLLSKRLKNVVFFGIDFPCEDVSKAFTCAY